MQTSFGPLPSLWSNGFWILRRLKWKGHEADHWSPPNAKIKNTSLVLCFKFHLGTHWIFYESGHLTWCHLVIYYLALFFSVCFLGEWNPQKFGRIFGKWLFYAPWQLPRIIVYICPFPYIYITFVLIVFIVNPDKYMYIHLPIGVQKKYYLNPIWHSKIALHFSTQLFSLLIVAPAYVSFSSFSKIFWRLPCFLLTFYEIKANIFLQNFSYKLQSFKSQNIFPNY